MRKVLIVGRIEGSSELFWANKINSIDAMKSFAEDVNQVANVIVNLGFEPIVSLATNLAYQKWHLPFFDKRTKIVSNVEIYQ